MTARNLGGYDAGLSAQEVLQILDAVHGLKRNVRAAQILTGIQGVHEGHDVGIVAAHLLELVLDQGHSHGHGHLEGAVGGSQGAALREGVEVIQHVALKLVQQGVVCLLHSDGSTVLGYSLGGHGLAVLQKSQVFIGHRHDGRQGQRHFVTFSNGAVLKRNARAAGHQLGARSLADGAHNAQDFDQGIPVGLKALNKVDFLDGNAGKLGSCGSVSDNGHVSSFLSSE